MTSIQPIETRYKGYRFRSRLEARWAVFFDALGVPWEYEKEGYELARFGRYLPDFYMPTVNLRTMNPGGGMWLEVKANTPTEEEEDKLYQVAESTGIDAGILWGDVKADPMGPGDSHYQIFPYWDNCMGFVQCPKCYLVKFEFAEGNYMFCERCNCRAEFDTGRISSAVHYARSARFEFGESGGVA